jgi:hypothetical protein
MILMYLDIGTSASATMPTSVRFKEYVIAGTENQPEIFYRGSDFIRRSGKIVMVWNEWWGKWEFWAAKEQLKMPFQAIKNQFDHRFRGRNRGRHWDRKVS